MTLLHFHPTAAIHHLRSTIHHETTAAILTSLLLAATGAEAKLLSAGLRAVF